MHTNKIEAKVVTTVKKYVVEFTEEEFQLLVDGIAVTSINGLTDAGMNKKQAEALHLLYDSLESVNDD